MEVGNYVNVEWY